jgi:hypothetical protein
MTPAPTLDAPAVGPPAAPAAPPVDIVDAALASGLDRAAAAGEWATVATLAGELAARRAARQTPPPSGGNVVALEDARRRRDGR